ncbi:linear amide C-N hydrolase [Streptomyces endophyticus]|uniref:Linear amide C-N hydrolase n=1 Tax=Streptomyces endophyticus TaxID=714166 RepID=A0ABU6F5Z0_9ACTN|nr:linear amide C-N hydrolase [Streptomyces endophyticus]MEB8339378.1 linear amide C-N hydrolase [Streptomyces endophyticus]
MCTRVIWTPEGFPALCGRNMDWKFDLHTDLWVTPRGVARDGAPGDPEPLTWTSRYGSVVATAYDRAVCDGMNEAGLAAHLLWLVESDYGERDTSKAGLEQSQWGQFVLDQFSTVAQLVDFLAAHPVQILAQAMQNTKGATTHLAVEDATGDSAVVEFLDGVAHVHHGPEHTVLTNSPSYEEQLANLKKYTGFGGDAPLPGTTVAADRFVRARYYRDHLPPPQSDTQAYAALLSVLRNTAEPFGLPEGDEPNISQTIWSTLSDLTNRVYAFASSYRTDIFWTDLSRLDFTRTQRLDLSDTTLAGDVTQRYAEAEPFSYAEA